MTKSYVYSLDTEQYSAAQGFAREIGIPAVKYMMQGAHLLHFIDDNELFPLDLKICNPNFKLSADMPLPYQSTPYGTLKKCGLALSAVDFTVLDTIARDNDMTRTDTIRESMLFRNLISRAVGPSCSLEIHDAQSDNSMFIQL